jgi:hypothetical protein
MRKPRVANSLQKASSHSIIWAPSPMIMSIGSASSAPKIVAKFDTIRTAELWLVRDVGHMVNSPSNDRVSRRPELDCFRVVHWFGYVPVKRFRDHYEISLQIRQRPLCPFLASMRRTGGYPMTRQRRRRPDQTGEIRCRGNSNGSRQATKCGWVTNNGTSLRRLHEQASRDKVEIGKQPRMHLSNGMRKLRSEIQSDCVANSLHCVIKSIPKVRPRHHYRDVEMPRNGKHRLDTPFFGSAIPPE